MLPPIGSTPFTIPDILPRQNAVGGGADAFSSVMESAIQRVETSRTQANGKVSELMAGEGGDLHTAAIAVQKAELELEMFLQVRNKVLQAYQEIMRSQM